MVTIMTHRLLGSRLGRSYNLIWSEQIRMRPRSAPDMDHAREWRDEEQSKPKQNMQLVGQRHTKHQCGRARVGAEQATSNLTSPTASARLKAWRRNKRGDQISVVSTMVWRPIETVTTPTTSCRPRLAQVRNFAEAAIGPATTVDSAPMPSIEPTPNSST